MDGYVCGAFEMTWDDDEKEVGMFWAELFKDVGQDRFLPIERAPAKENRRVVRDAERLEGWAKIAGRPRRLGAVIEFDASGDMKA